MDQPYLVERPDGLRRRSDGCQASGLTPTRAPAWQLDRWKVVRDLIVGWYRDPRPDAESVPTVIGDRAGWLDPVQRFMVERLFAGWRAMFPKEPDVEVDLDPPGASVFDHDRGIELRVATTFGFSRPDGSVEVVRLKTGQTPTGPDDAAVLHHEAGPGVVFLDAMVGAGVAEEIVAPPDAGTRLAELFDLAARPGRPGLTPGPHCFSCASAPRCGQYPQPSPARIYGSTRSITVSKTQLGWLDVCHRRVAWDRLHRLRLDDDGEVELGRGLAMGNVFHETAAAAILSDDPAAVVDAACATVAPSEASELRRLWGNHLTLWSDDGEPQARSTEYPAGVTLMAPGPHDDSRGRRSVQPVAVTMIGILDVTGREPDGRPMVVEHRTGVAPEHGHLELDLYAVSAAEAVRRHAGEWPEGVAVHLHLLGAPEPECRRAELDRASLVESLTRLQAAAGVIAGWDPADALHPAFSVGPWCDGCRQRRLCEQFR